MALNFFITAEVLSCVITWIGPDGEKVSRAQRAAGPFGHVDLRDLFDDRSC